MRRLFIPILTLLISVSLWASDSTSGVYQGFSGGMMGHFGYLFGKNPSNTTGFDMEGGTFGLGGAIRVNLWKVLRVGGEGYVSTMSSGLSTMHSRLAKGSYIRNGWGGILADACYRGNKVWPYIGASIGGGAERTLLMTRDGGNQNDWSNNEGTVFHKYGYFYVAPYIGMDIVVTTHFHVTTKLDWVTAIHKAQLVRPTGPRLYVGFMFCR